MSNRTRPVKKRRMYKKSARFYELNKSKTNWKYLEEVVYLYEQTELTMDQIAEQLGRARSTISAAYARAKRLGVK